MLKLAELKKIASRSGEPGFAFASDEDTRGIDPDPHSMRYDMTNDLVDYAKSQAKLVSQSMPHVVDDSTKEGEGYQRARRTFGILLARYGEIDVRCVAIRWRPVREPQPQGRPEGAEAAGSGAGRAATRGVGPAGRASV